MSAVESWKVPEEYLFDGVKLMGNIFTPAAAQSAKDFKFRQDDIIIVSFPMSGECVVTAGSCQGLSWCRFNSITNNAHVGGEYLTTAGSYHELSWCGFNCITKTHMSVVSVSLRLGPARGCHGAALTASLITHMSLVSVSLRLGPTRSCHGAALTTSLKCTCRW